MCHIGCETVLNFKSLKVNSYPAGTESDKPLSPV